MNTSKRQKKAISYYDRFSKVYDLLSPKAYYHKARKLAVKELKLRENTTIINLPVGTGQNFKYFQSYLNNTGLIVGVDLSTGMLDKAQRKIDNNNWNNIQLLNIDATTINCEILNPSLKRNNSKGVASILIDLGLSGFPYWESCIDTYLSILNPGGRIVIMDWYIEQYSLRGELIKWVGKGEVNRPIWQYLQSRVDDFKVNTSFNRGGVFVASGTKIS